MAAKKRKGQSSSPASPPAPPEKLERAEVEALLDPPRTIRWKVTLVVIVAVIMTALVLLHVRGVNGPWYWKWSWRRLPWWMFAAMLPALAPFVVAQWMFARGRVRIALAGLFITSFAMQLSAIACQPGGIVRLPLLVANPSVTSYWIDASVLLVRPDFGISGMLTNFDLLQPLLHVHAKYKPPGLILYYQFWIVLLGLEGSAWVGGLGVALLAAAATLGTFALIRFYSRGETTAAFCGASFLALCPSLVLFLPQFDQAYLVLACGILLTWGRAARDLDWRAAVACGALLALATFCSYIFLTLGCFILLYWLLLAADRGVDHWLRAAVNGAIALGTAVVLYALLWAWTGFDPIATFDSIAREQMRDLIPLTRPFPRHILFDVLDFALASGWIGFLLVLFFLARTGRRIVDRTPRNRLALVALLHIGTVALAALLPGETARLWTLMLPLLMAPIGCELAHWPARARMTVFACLFVVTVAVGQNMLFNYVPELDGERQFDLWPRPGPDARR